MKRVFLGASLVLVLVLGTNHSWSAAGDDKDWVQLFNGKDTKGWKVHPDEPGDWSVKDGILIGKGPKRSHIYTDARRLRKLPLPHRGQDQRQGQQRPIFPHRVPRKGRLSQGLRGPDQQHPSRPAEDRQPLRLRQGHRHARAAGYLVHPGSHRQGQSHHHSGERQEGGRFRRHKNTYTKGHFAIQQHPPAAAARIDHHGQKDRGEGTPVRQVTAFAVAGSNRCRLRRSVRRR